MRDLQPRFRDLSPNRLSIKQTCGGSHHVKSQRHLGVHLPGSRTGIIQPQRSLFRRPSPDLARYLFNAPVAGTIRLQEFCRQDRL